MCAPRPVEAGEGAEEMASPARITLLWTALQLVPSPEVVVWNGATRFGMRWQVTPLLYSFGRNRRMSPWRSFVVEPIARHSGSTEVYLSPEIVTGVLPSTGDHFIFRAGVRSYFPLLQRGESLSASLGTSVLESRGRVGVGVDVGLSTFGGFVSLRLGYCPTPGLRMTTVTFELRAF